MYLWIKLQLFQGLLRLLQRFTVVLGMFCVFSLDLLHFLGTDTVAVIPLVATRLRQEEEQREDSFYNFEFEKITLLFFKIEDAKYFNGARRKNDF